MWYKLVVSLTRSQKGWILLANDLVCTMIALFLSVALVSNSQLNSELLLSLLVYGALVLPVSAALIVFFGIHTIKLNAYGVQGVAESASVAIVAALVGLSVALTGFVSPDIPKAAFAVFAMAIFVLSVGSRITLRFVVLKIYGSANMRKKVLIYGAGQTGQQLAAALLTDDEFIAAGFVDDNATVQKLTISGLKVHDPSAIRKIVERQRIDRVVLAMPSADQFNRLRIIKSLKGIGCEVLAVPSFAEMVIKGKNIAPTLEPVETSKFLGREKFENEMSQNVDTYRGKNILVTGAGGSIGSELCRQLLNCKPTKLLVLDHSELALYNIHRELLKFGVNFPIVPVLGSICDRTLVRETLNNHDIQVVFHAAAYKHVPMVEQNCIEGLRNNVLGTKTLAEEAKIADVERFIFISSDKAVRPTSIMGASKRLAEIAVQDLATRSDKTLFAMVRFGNVLGSSGSVIPLFEDQIRRGGPVTVTDRSVTRFFMTISEAVGLVLLAGTYSRGGDVFVLDMGKPVLIEDLARQMIEGSGYTVRDEDNPQGDIEIEFIGLRPGEKLHEELLIGSDMLTTPHTKILRAQENHPSEIEVANLIQDLRKTVETRNTEAAVDLVKKWVEPDFDNAEQKVS